MSDSNVIEKQQGSDYKLLARLFSVFFRIRSF